MTPIKKFRVSWIDRCLYRRRPLFRNLAIVIAVILVSIAILFSIKQHKMYYESEQLISAAEADRDMALSILRGERTAITEDGEQVARVTWEKVQLVGGL